MAHVLKHLRGKIVAGLVTVAPILATIWILKVLFNFFDSFAAPILDPLLPFHIPGLGVIIGLLFMYLLGIFVTNFLGRKLVIIGESLLRRIPLANTIYGTAKQITQSITGASNRAFQKAVLISYPRVGIWTIAFVTGESKDANGTAYYHLFVPTTPNPTSGVMVMIPRGDAIDSKLTVEEGLKMIISGGMLAPKENEITSLPK
ncbi:MAG: hypothetical protein CMG71_03250 [Candidatus Marinimicrobia bacterium]|nr:hypothetical protein [Candidatus Neomarinimicrobiota bacterium]|tara:strand:- start:12228 stop:12836 length:609 start_codon:yes stop_codon:yes gene_type:complete